MTATIQAQEAITRLLKVKGMARTDFSVKTPKRRVKINGKRYTEFLPGLYIILHLRDDQIRDIAEDLLTAGINIKYFYTEDQKVFYPDFSLAPAGEKGKIIVYQLTEDPTSGNAESGPYTIGRPSSQFTDANHNLSEVCPDDYPEPPADRF